MNIVAKVQEQENILRRREGNTTLLVEDGVAGAKTWDAISARYDKLTPVPTVGATFDGIIDINHNNGFSPLKLWGDGIRAIIHKGSEGNYMSDPQHGPRREVWKGMGGLWGSYLFLIAGRSIDEQGSRFIEAIKYQKGDRIAIDWENNPNGGAPPTLGEVDAMARYLHDKLGIWPDLYFGNALTDLLAPGEPPIDDTLIKTLRPWYVRLASKPVGFPYQIWPNGPWLWQNREGGIAGSDGADGNVYFGTEEQLRSTWNPQTS